MKMNIGIEIIFGFFIFLPFGFGIQIDNAVVGLPEVQCMDEMVKMTFRTQRPFTGRIFVKGMVDKDTCVSSYKTNSANSVEYHLKNGQCNMRRQRRLGPQKGIEQSMTVIISFHDTFITKVDRAYRCTCFFMEADKIVTSNLEVSMIPTVDLIDTARMPLCTYSVHADAVDGPVMTHAKVGETAFHVWECDGDMFGMLVHSCTVDDGSGQGRFQLLDNHGCAVDPVILTDLQYKPEATHAFVEAPVFKFADKNNIYFQCSISLCMKNDGACTNLTPPICNRTRARRIRQTDNRLISESEIMQNQSIDLRYLQSLVDMDVAPATITVLDMEDIQSNARSQGGFASYQNQPENFYDTLQGGNQNRKSSSQLNFGVNEVCIQATAFITGLVFTLLMILITASISFYCYVRRFMKTQKSDDLDRSKL